MHFIAFIHVCHVFHGKDLSLHVIHSSFVDLLCFCSVLCLLCLCARLFICALWSPAGKGLTWPLGSRLWCLTVSLSLSHWYPRSGVVLDCIHSWSLHPYLLWNFIECRTYGCLTKAPSSLSSLTVMQMDDDLLVHLNVYIMMTCEKVQKYFP